MEKLYEKRKEKKVRIKKPISATYHINDIAMLRKYGGGKFSEGVHKVLDEYREAIMAKIEVNPLKKSA